MINFILIASAAFAVTFVYSSFFEWALHKYIMHMDRFMKYPYRTHQLEHHEIFKADGTYFLHDEKDLSHVTFAWWNAPLLFSLHAPFLTLAYFFAGGWGTVLGASAALLSYYGLYEYFHYCMHVPSNRFFERTRLFQFVQTHHRLHHVHYMKNLNVVFPIADTILRTRVSLKDAELFNKLESVRIRRQERTALSPEKAILPTGVPAE